MIEKFVNYRTSKKQSIEFLPTLIKLLKENQVQKAIDVAKGANYKKAHIAKVVSAGLTEYQTQQSGVAQNYDRIGAIRTANCSSPNSASISRSPGVYSSAMSRLSPSTSCTSTWRS